MSGYLCLDGDRSPTKLTLKDKYFSFKKEQRINRMQFFVRSITGAALGLSPLLIGLLLLIIGQQIGIVDTLDEGEAPSLGMIITTIIASLSGLIPWYILCINVCKRAHDYDYRGLVYNLAYYIGAPIAYVIGIFGTTMLYVDDGGDGAVISGIFVGLFLSCMVQMIVLSILQFRPGNLGSNKYGPAPTGKPLI